MAKPLSTAEILRYDWRKNLFLQKYKEGSEFRLINTEVNLKFSFNEKFYSIIESEDRNGMNKIKLWCELTEKWYRLSEIEKTEEFGGKGTGSGTRREDHELKNINDQLSAIKMEYKIDVVPIRIGSNVHYVDTAESTPGTPKSDFHFLSPNKTEVVWISHKHGKTPRHFQQWGGVTEKEPMINAHPEVQQFVSDLHDAFPNGMEPTTVLYREIRDEKLKNMAIYGCEFGQENYGQQNVSVVIQGNIEIKPSEDVFEISGTISHLNGESVPQNYDPVLCSVYRTDRKNCGLVNTRLMITPKGGRTPTGEI